MITTEFRLMLILLLAFININFVSGLTQEDTQPFIYGGFSWSPDSEIIAVGASDGVWLHSAEDLSIIEQLVEQEFVTSLDWNPENNLLYQP